MHYPNKANAKVFKAYPDAVLPTKPTSVLDSGWDVSAHNLVKHMAAITEVKHSRVIEEDISNLCDFSKDGVVLNPGDRALIGTGIIVTTDPGYEIQVRSRSGLSLKQGLTVTNSPGTVDSAVYRKELGVILTNTSATQQKISKGDRIAQIVLAEVCIFDSWQEVGSVEEMGTTERGESGFGSSGK